MDKNELEIFNKNEKLVPFTYNKYFATHKNHKDDLLQEGFLSLINCIGKFDASRGQFSTFAIKVIKNAMSRWLYKLNTKTSKNISLDLVPELGNNFLGQDEQYDRISFKTTVNKSIDLFNDKQKDIIKNWVNGLKSEEIANDNNCSNQYILQVIKKFKYVFRHKWDLGETSNNIIMKKITKSNKGEANVKRFELAK